jgi:hypothetical protein
VQDGNPAPFFEAEGTKLYLVPYNSTVIALYDGSAWVYRSPVGTVKAEGPFPPNTNYAVYAYWDGTTVQLELTNSTNNSVQDGVQVKNGDPSRRYIGAVRSGWYGAILDNRAQRFVWNRHNQVPHPILKTYLSGWSFSGTNSWRPVSGNPANGRVEVMVGEAHGGWAPHSATAISVSVTGMCTSSLNGYWVAAGIGINSTTSVPMNAAQTNELDVAGPNSYAHISSSYEGYLFPGYNTVNWLEIGMMGATYSCIGHATSPPFGQLGLVGTVLM